MKALAFHSYGSPEVLAIEDVPDPKPAERHILVQVHAAAINPKDILVRKGKFRRFTGKHFPQFSGYDLAGEVIALGENVQEFIIGEPVFAMLNGWIGGACAQFASVPVGEAAPMPPGFTFEEAASVPLAALTALQALRDEGKLRAGQEVCINGASGGVGVFAVQIAKILGARVTAVCSHRNIELVQQLGADATIDYTRRDVLETAQSCDIFFDVFGNKSFSGAKSLLKKRGKYITTVPKLRNFVDAFFSTFRRKTARVVLVKSNRADLELIAEWLIAGKLKPVIDRVYPLTAAAEAHRYIETKRARGKVVLTIES